MIFHYPSENIRRRDISGWSDQREIRTCELRGRRCGESTADSSKGDVRNAVGIRPNKTEWRRKHKSVRAPLPGRASRRDALLVPGDVEFSLVDETRTDSPHFAGLVTVPWTD